MQQESKGNVIWKRPSEYIADYYLTKEIASRFPLKNIIKFKKLIYDVYFHSECPVENKKKKKNNNIFHHKNNDKGEYTSENKRIFKSFFGIFDKQDFYIIKHRDKGDNFVDSDDCEENFNEKNRKISLNATTNNSSKNNFNSIKKQGGLDNNSNNTAAAVKNINNEVTHAVKFKSADGRFISFFPRKIVIEEKACYFTKWLSSILQFIREFNISDDVINLFAN